ncbi:M12 family metallopeptidase [Roseicella aquatilis]|uniref:Peptidase M12A domain-containing protein n=1 Tax=Roseicella aquatilis TaxID=2527868 RepID=A0A4R4DGS2_9PROT|nr:M12 family metallopeptidase [Roseicella aquatilis]TCZ58777.1 hypothetical protein EXY23_16340 [Roseicella aquatilis]
MGLCLKASASNRWVKGVVPYRIDDAAFPLGSAVRQAAIQAINAWNTTTVVTLRAATAGDADVIFITSSADPDASSSPFGRQGGSQNVACTSSATAGTVIHEIGHALGLIHEHKRPDRERYIDIKAANIEAGRSGQFSPADTTNCPVGAYDCGSIMHYGARFFSVDDSLPAGDTSKDTITIKDAARCANIGQRTALSTGDIATVRAMYDSVTGLADKITLPETTDNAPALAFHDNALFLAWRGSGNDNLNVAVSDDRGGSVRGKHVSPETSDDAPALASHNGRLFIAFKGSGNDNINVAQVSRQPGGTRDVAPLGAKVTLGDETDAAPALASHRGNLYLAFKGSGNDNLNVMVSTDNGATFGRKHVSAETSSHAPALVSSGGTLYIAWKGSGNENLNVAAVDVGTDASNPAIAGFTDKVTFGDTTEVAPSLVAQAGLLVLGWKGAGNDNFNLLFPADHDGCTQKFTTPESSSHGPALAADSQTIWVAWKGSGNENINLASAEFASQAADSVAQGLQAMNDDIFNQLVQMQATLAAGLQNISQGLSQSLAQQQFTNQALLQKIAQEATMVCQLEQIAERTCTLVAEAHRQTGLQHRIADDVQRLLAIAQATHPAAEIELQRLDRLRQEIERCCPPAEAPPACAHAACPPPPPFRGGPPEVDYRPIPPPPELRDGAG